jgi:aromatic ring hydroxylase-like protein
VSTVDLIGDGLTLFTATEDPQWSSVGEATGWTAPLQVVAVDVETAAALGLSRTSALLVRPDGHEVARWLTADTAPERGPAPRPA